MIIITLSLLQPHIYSAYKNMITKSELLRVAIRRYYTVASLLHYMRLIFELTTQYKKYLMFLNLKIGVYIITNENRSIIILIP